MKRYNRPRAYYDGLINGGLIGMAIGILLIMYLFNENGISVPLPVVFVTFGLLIFGVSLTAYDAHKAVSAPQ